MGILPAWGENNRNEIAAGRAKTPSIRPVLLDRVIPPVQARLEELEKLPQPLSAADQKEFIEATKRLKLLTDRRGQILARVGDEFVMDPPKVAVKP